MPRHLFVYGSLMFSELAEAVIGRSPQWEPAFLPGYKRRSIGGTPYAVILPDSGETVEGLLLKDLDESELARLDAYEGELYAPIQVVVARADGSETAALAYGIAAGLESRVSDEAWSIDHYERTELPRAMAEIRGSGA